MTTNGDIAHGPRISWQNWLPFNGRQTSDEQIRPACCRVGQRIAFMRDRGVVKLRNCCSSFANSWSNQAANPAQHSTDGVSHWHSAKVPDTGLIDRSWELVQRGFSVFMSHPPRQANDLEHGELTIYVLQGACHRTPHPRVFFATRLLITRYRYLIIFPRDHGVLSWTHMRSI